MTIKHKIPDPIHGHITIPDWLREMESCPPVRRMLYIRQLGLKSSIDFPGAIHTRYGHSLGTMHLAGVLTETLAERMHDVGNKRIEENLKNNKNILMAAGLLHDIAHGPFSHAVDFVLYKTANTTHEILSEKVINGELKGSLRDHGIDAGSVVDIINKKHNFKFLSGIVNGPMDVDKLDYLLRDAYHVGLKYAFDSDHFISSYTVLGDDSDLSKCQLGLDDTPTAIVTAEIFVMIWKGMYDLVYHVRDSRIAEKMLEKATLLDVNDDGKIKEHFTNKDLLLSLDDEELLGLLKNSKNSYTKILEERIRNRKLFESMNDIYLYNDPSIEPNFITKIAAAKSEEIDEISDRISLALCKKMGVDNYRIICDIVTTRVPKSMFIDAVNNDVHEPSELRNVSDIIRSIKERNTMRIYFDKDAVPNQPQDLFTKVKDIMKEEVEA